MMACTKSTAASHQEYQKRMEEDMSLDTSDSSDSEAGKAAVLEEEEASHG